jgi:hypothetical protein
MMFSFSQRAANMALKNLKYIIENRGFKADKPVKSRKISRHRHSGEGRNPELVEFTGFRPQFIPYVYGARMTRCGTFYKTIKARLSMLNVQYE